MMNRKMVDAVLQMGEYNRFSKGMFGWVGFQTKWLDYHNVERAAGETKWSMRKLMKYSLDGILGFSTIPLSLSSYGGIFFCGIAFLTVCFLVIRYLIFHDPVQGWTTLMCAIFFIGGVQLLCVGILGQYLARAYMEVKKRPIYLLKEKSDEKNTKVDENEEHIGDLSSDFSDDRGEFVCLTDSGHHCGIENRLDQPAYGDSRLLSKTVL